MFDWLLSNEVRIWIFVAVCVITIFAAAAASLIDLFWEMAIASVVGLVVSAEYGFFVGLMVFTLLLLVLYIWGGRHARVRAAS